MKTVLTALYNLLASMSPAVRLVIGITSIAVAVNSYINEMWSELFARLDSLAGVTIGGADFSALGLINYVFPLDTILTFLVAYAALRAGCVGVRMIKAFIPTIS